jgi:hypothetical protein
MKRVATRIEVDQDDQELQPHQTVESLKAALEREWNNPDLRMINRIVDNFPKRVDACICARGRHFE